MRYHEGTMLLGWSGGYNIPHQCRLGGGGRGPQKGVRQYSIGWDYHPLSVY